MHVLSGSRTPIGLDMGTAQVKAAQLKGGGKTLAAWSCFDRLSEDPIPTDAEVGRILGTLDRGGFTGSSLVLGVPHALLKSAVVKTPPSSSEAPIDLICREEFTRLFGAAQGNWELHFREVAAEARQAGGAQFAVCGIDSIAAEALVDRFERSGLHVEAIDVWNEASARATRPACVHDADLTTVLDLGIAGVGLTVFRAGTDVYSRWLPDAGVGRWEDAIARSLTVERPVARRLLRTVGGTSPEWAGLDQVTAGRVLGLGRDYVDFLLRETLRSVAYVLDQYPGESVSRIRLVGGGACVPGMVDMLGEMAGLDVSRVDDFAIAGSPEDIAPILHVAIGHAKWGGVSSEAAA